MIGESMLEREPEVGDVVENGLEERFKVIRKDDHFLGLIKQGEFNLEYISSIMWRDLQGDWNKSLTII